MSSKEEIEYKKCFACKETKPIFEYYKSNVRYYQNECKECNKTRKQAWHKTDQGKRSSANTKLKARFGITLEQYEEMYASQDGKCLICGVQESVQGHRLAVDHCHTTGKIRGLLCKSCNVGLGNFYDNPELLKNAAKYIEGITK